VGVDSRRNGQALITGSDNPELAACQFSLSFSGAKSPDLWLAVRLVNWPQIGKIAELFM